MAGGRQRRPALLGYADPAARGWAGHALALAAGSAWLVADDRDAVEIAWTGDRFTVTFRAGLAATCKQILPAHGTERNRT